MYLSSHSLARPAYRPMCTSWLALTRYGQESKRVGASPELAAEGVRNLWLLSRGRVARTIAAKGSRHRRAQGNPDVRYRREVRRPHTRPVVDLHHRVDRVRVRYLRAAGAAADSAAGAGAIGRPDLRQRGVHRLGAGDVLCSGVGGRRVRDARRLFDRLIGPATHPDVEHPAVRRFDVCRRHEHVAGNADVLPLFDVHRRVRRVRRGRSLAGGTVRRPQAAGARSGVHAGLFLGGRADGHGRLQSGGCLGDAAPGNPRCSTSRGGTR